MKYLYVIESGMEYLKIGVSNDVENRLAALQTGNPVPLRVLACFEFPNADIVERAIHQQFSSKKVQGEWFRLSAEDFTTLCTACEILGGKRVSERTIITQGDVEDAQEQQSLLEDFRIEKRINPANGEIRGYVFRSRDNRRAIVKYVGKRSNPEEFKELIAFEDSKEEQ